MPTIQGCICAPPLGKLNRGARTLTANVESNLSKFCQGMFPSRLFQNVVGFMYCIKEYVTDINTPPLRKFYVVDSGILRYLNNIGQKIDQETMAIQSASCAIVNKLYSETIYMRNNNSNNFSDDRISFEIEKDYGIVDFKMNSMNYYKIVANIEDIKE